MNRFHKEIPYQAVHLICSLEKKRRNPNITKKGFKVVSYSLSSQEACYESYKSKRKGIENLCVSD